MRYSFLREVTANCEDPIIDKLKSDVQRIGSENRDIPAGCYWLWLRHTLWTPSREGHLCFSQPHATSQTDSVQKSSLSLITLLFVCDTAGIDSFSWSCTFFPFIFLFFPKEFTWPVGFFPDSSQCCQWPPLQPVGSWFLDQRWQTHRSGTKIHSPVHTDTHRYRHTQKRKRNSLDWGYIHTNAF